MRRGGIGHKAFRAVLAFCLALTVVATAITFPLRYGQEIDQVSAQIDRMREAQLPAMEASLWTFDAEQTRALLEGLVTIPCVRYAAVTAQDGKVLSAGARDEAGEMQAFPLSVTRFGRVTFLGKLEIQVDRKRILAEVAREVLLSLGLQAALLVLECFFILWIFDRLATRRLERVAAYVRAEGGDLSQAPLVLERRGAEDELDLLASAYNELRSRLEGSRASERRILDKLRQSEERYRALVEAAPDAILIYDVEAGRFVECNDRAVELFGRDRDYILSHSIPELYGAARNDSPSIEASVRSNDERALAGESLVIRREIAAGDGGIRVFELRLTRFPSPDRKLLRSSYLDITERVRAEEAMATSLREKEVLLQEVYHRTKNNMQVISSLLDLEALFSEDEKLRELARDMNARIGSMALVHQKLYDSRDLSRIDLGEYLLELAAGIRREYLGGRPELELVAEAEKGIVAPFDVAIPCGLALTEVLVNAIRHGYPPGLGRGGRIEARLWREGPGRLGLSVRDDGIGLGEGFNLQRDGRIGLRTIASLVEAQLRGTLELRTEGGTVFKARFRDDVYDVRL